MSMACSLAPSGAGALFRRLHASQSKEILQSLLGLWKTTDYVSVAPGNREQCASSVSERLNCSMVWSEEK